MELRTNEKTWSAGFTNALKQKVPGDFIKVFSYGQPDSNPLNGLWSQGWPCSTKPLLELAEETDSFLSAVEDQLHNDWAFTRYDAVGHSQGGVLLRMLCQDKLVSGANPVVSQRNFNRGRFRRIVTIGSPHNGSLIMYYMRKMRQSNMNFDIAFYNTAYFSARAMQKFDSDGDIIRTINDPRFPIDERIAFHCIQTTINNGWSPGFYFDNAPVYNILGLNSTIQGGPYDGFTRGQVLLPFGSDGVVDLLSQGGGVGTHKSYNFNNVAHAGVPYLFGNPTPVSQTSSLLIGANVAVLLSGSDNNFGPFVIPAIITDAEKAKYDSLVPNALYQSLGIVTLLRPQYASTNIEYEFSLPAGLPIDGGVNWQAQNYDRNGVVTNGIFMQVNTNNTALMTLSIDGGVIGQVIVTANYTTTNGDAVFSIPVVAVSRPPTVGASLTNIEIQPAIFSLNVGDTIPTQLWGDFSDGSRCLLYAPPNQVAYSSLQPQIGIIDTNGNLTLVSQGATLIQAVYSGFVAQALLSTAQPSAPRVLFPSKTNSTFAFTIFGSLGVTNAIQSSTNLVQWNPLATLLPTNALTGFSDPATKAFPQKFYRVLVPATSTNVSGP